MIEPTQIEKEIKQARVTIERARENISLEKEKISAQLQHIKPLNPQFEFEVQPKYIELAQKNAQIELRRKIEDLQSLIQDYEERIKFLEEKHAEEKRALSRDYVR